MSKQINSFGEGLVSWRAYNREGGGVGVGAYQWGTYACKQQFNVPYLFAYKPISAISRDPKLLGIRTC